MELVKADQHKQDMLEKMIKDTKKENKDARQIEIQSVGQRE